MAQASTAPTLTRLQVRITQEVFPPYHAMHGTPHTVVQRLFTFEFPQGTAEVDQTDYGHPGRFNPCHARRIPTPLQSKTNQIVAAAEALAALLD
ncbi:MAG TPA: hypothetical protein VKZ60_12355 [Chloroflexota bacterium]|jgi:hypothetical protein|nr:hypothetical protein [Chloroflexota bacterium]